MTEPQKKQNLFWAFLKAYWWAIVIILLAPVLLNFIILIPAFLPIAGDSEEWLSFHGGYIGSVIASLITLYVLYKQLQHSHAENEKTRQKNETVNKTNRQLQLNILKYEQSRQWLTELKVRLTDYYTAFSLHDVRNLGDLILVNPSDVNVTTHKQYIQELIKKILIKMEAADFAKGILFFKMDNTELGYLDAFKSFTIELYSLLEDLDWFSQSVCFYNGSATLNQDMYERETEKYRSSEENLHKGTCQKIWSIIESFNYNIFDQKKTIITIRMSEAMRVLDPSIIQTNIAQLIDYEARKINKILTDEHGTR